jgi:hypothetical protein
MKRRIWSENKGSEEEEKSQPRTKGRELPMTRHISLMTRWRSHIVTRQEEKFPEEDRVVGEVLLEEEEEEEEEK